MVSGDRFGLSSVIAVEVWVLPYNSKLVAGRKAQPVDASNMSPSAGSQARLNFGLNWRTERSW